jgi:hypothetical protein
VDFRDLTAWDLVYNNDANLCPVEPATSLAQSIQARLISDEPSGTGRPDIVVAAKTNIDGHRELLFPGELRGEFSPGEALTCPPGRDCNYGLARLIKDASQNVYVVHGVQGILRQETGDAIVRPGAATFQGMMVSVGLTADGQGHHLSDAAFDPSGEDLASVYVVPVQVAVPGDATTPEHVYLAAARLQVIGGGDWTVAALYGLDSMNEAMRERYPCLNCVPTGAGSCRPACDFSGMREIELDGNGNIYVAAASAYNENDWILVFNESSLEPGFEKARIALPAMFQGGSVPPPASPGAMFYSRPQNTLYLGSLANSLNGVVGYVYRFTPDAQATMLTFDGVVQIDGATALPEACGTCIGYTSTIVSILGNRVGRMWVVGMTSLKFPEEKPLDSSVGALFTAPMMAEVPPGTTWSTTVDSAVSIQATKATGSIPTLPISAVLLEPAPGDLNEDGVVDQSDVTEFIACTTGPAMGPPASNCTAADLDVDGDVDVADFGYLQRLLNLTE